MPRFSAQSTSNLSTCHPDLQALFFEVIKHIDCTVLEGHRGEEAQNAAWAAGNSKLKWPDGKHNAMPSLAVDVAPCPVDWKKLSNFYYFGGFVMGVAKILREQGKMSHSVRYGGDWNGDGDLTNEKFVDAVHFELVP